MSRHTTELIRRRPAAPEAPAAPTVSGQTTTQVVVAWARVPNASGYRLERSTNQTTWTAVYTGATLTYTDTGLTAATTYYYRVTATSSVGNSPTSPALTASTAATGTPPATPATSPTVADVGPTRVTFVLATVAGGVTYQLQRAAAAVGPWTQVYSGVEQTADVTGLTPATVYLWRYTAANSDGTSGASPVVTQPTTAATAAPATPTRPTATASTSTTVAVSWAAVTAATTYTLQRSTTQTGTYTTIYTGGATTFTDTNRAPSTTYWYRVAAANTTGASAYSTATSVVTLAATTTTVQPVSARFLVEHSGFRVAPHENSSTSPYKGENADAICRYAADIGLTYVRGMYDRGGYGVPDWVAALKRYNLKWLMTLVPEGAAGPTDQALAETKAKVRAIRDDPDLSAVCLGLEGINEPNHNRSGLPVPSDWPTTVHQHQVAIYEIARPPDGTTTSLSNVIIVGPSLHATAASNSYTQPAPSGGRFHFHQVRDAGTLDYMDEAGLHTYPNGSLPETGLVNRLEHLYDAYGADYPVFVSEFGYSNNTAGGLGNPVSPEVSGVYIPRGYLQYVIGHTHTAGRRNFHMTVYEALDNWNPARTDRESWFGIIGTAQYTETASRTAVDARTLAADPVNFYYKPAGDSLKGLLSPLKEAETVGVYTPAQVTLEVATSATNVLWWCVATKAQSDVGRASLFLVRDAVYNATPVDVRVTDRQGAHPSPYAVGGALVKVDLR